MNKFYLLFVLCSFLVISTVFAENRTALIIGNSAYPEAPLKNPSNDAKAIATKLKTLGFDVILKVDASQQQIREAIETFGRKLEIKKGVGLFFYAGHGIQSKGENYLIPTDITLTRETQLRSRAINVNEILAEMEYANNKLNLVILDACRNNPLVRSFRSAKRGLARMNNTPSGLLLAYSTAPGSVAEDSNSNNSPYTQQLIQALSHPNWDLEKVFKETAKGVKKATRGKQIPWISSSITLDFYFNQNHINQPVINVNQPPVESNTHADIESHYWDSVVKLNSKLMYEAYLKEYPEGHYATIAKIKIAQYKRLEKPKSKPKPKPRRPTNGEIKKWITDYYNNKGVWHGTFRIRRIDQLRVVPINQDKIQVHAKYHYYPIPGNRKRRTDSGSDQRIFYLKRTTRRWVVTEMGGFNSARF